MNDDELPLNEPVVTGWVQTQLSGDIALAASHKRDARRVLGQMLIDTGVNDRLAAGQPGGYFKTVKTLDDGTRVTAWHNNGQNVLRIESHPPVPEVREEELVLPEAPRWEGEPRQHRPAPLEAAGEVPEVESPPIKHIELEEEELTKKYEDDYLWVGVRIKDGCTRPFFALDVNMVEPDGTGMRGVIGTAFSTTNGWTKPNVDYAVSGDDEQGWRLDRNADFSNAFSIGEALQAMYDEYAVSNGDLPPFSPNMIYGDHQVSSTLLLDGGFDNYVTINWSFNGLMFQYWDDGPDGDFAQAYGPYDPLATPEENAGSARSYDGMQDTAFDHAPAQRFAWDAVYWLDPYDDEVGYKYPVQMVDDRPLITAFRTKLYEEGMLDPKKRGQQILEGVYQLVIRADDNPPHRTSTRGGEAIPESERIDSNPNWFRSGSGDYAQYMKPVDNWPALEVEVEVRMGREATSGVPMRKFNFEVSCESYDNREAVTWPFGEYTYDQCLNDGGPNMGGPSYAAVVNISLRPEMNAELGALPVDRVFGTGSYTPFQDVRRKPARFFVFGGEFPQPDDATFVAGAAQGLFQAMEAVTSNSYGGATEMSQSSVSELFGIFTGCNKDHVYMFDPVTHDITDLGAPHSVAADYNAYSPPLVTAFHWFYEFATPYANECINIYGVLVTSAGQFYEMEPNLVGAPGYSNPDCCA